jgi:imidazoleglycerol-phosphate dehydratase
MTRTATRTRTTRETDIAVTLNLDGTGACRVATGIGFFDHMLELFARHALVDLEIKAKGDVHVDYHHTVEDVGLVLGACLNEALGARRGITRYASVRLPMDEALFDVAVDLGGRPFLVFASGMKHLRAGDFEVKLVEEFFRALTTEGRLNLHLIQVSGDEPHHICESVFKGFARALRAAAAPDPRETGVPSSKGTLA